MCLLFEFLRYLSIAPFLLVPPPSRVPDMPKNAVLVLHQILIYLGMLSIVTYLVTSIRLVATLKVRENRME